MKHARIIVTRYGGPNALQVLEEGCPEPKRGEVQAKVLAARVSLTDLMMREGSEGQAAQQAWFNPNLDDLWSTVPSLVGILVALRD